MRTIAALTGVAAIAAGCGIASADVPVGPGPNADYTMQPQPAPGACHYRAAADGSTLPDPLCTPGATNPDVTEATLYSTVCKQAYSASIRPPREVTNVEKRSNAASYDYRGSLADTEYDHLIPLALGGDPNDPRNLWVEPTASPNPKDDVEFRLIQLVCRRTVALSDAQAAIANDWTTALAVLRQS